jgi:hypothetical protein
VAAYRRAITRGCDLADNAARARRDLEANVRLVPRWHPHQPRHNAATELREEFAADALRKEHKVTEGLPTIENTAANREALEHMPRSGR